MGLPQKKRQSDCSVVVVCKSDSGGEYDKGYLLQTFKVLYDFYRMRSHHTHR